MKKFNNLNHTPKVGVAVFLALIIAIFVLFGLPDKNSDDSLSLNLESYFLHGDPLVIDIIESEASGLAYNPYNDSLLLVSGRPATLFELSKQGKVLKTVPLHGFLDPEAVTIIDSNHIAILDERDSHLVYISYPSKVAILNKEDGTLLPLESVVGLGNHGPEGIAYDHDKKIFYFAKEKYPRTIFRVENWPETITPIITKYWPTVLTDRFHSDYSGLELDTDTKHLLVLSDENRILVEKSMDGKELSALCLEKGCGNLEEDIRQPEGVAMDKEKNIYILGEPNILYTFKR